MTEFVGYVSEILGAPPAGFEPLEYVFAGTLLVIVVMSAVSMISGIFKWIGGM